jgi:hypothetical protein
MGKKSKTLMKAAALAGAAYLASKHMGAKKRKLFNKNHKINYKIKSCMLYYK